MKHKILAALGKRKVQLNPSCFISSRAELMLYGLIGDWFDGMDAATIVQLISEFESDEIRVHIHSDGGNIMDGLAIYHQLKQSDKKVITYIDGVAASMAGAIFLAGSERYIPANGIWHMHRAHAGEIGGDVDAIIEAAEALGAYENTYLGILSEGTGKSVEDIKAIISDRKDHFYQGQAAIDFGAATHLIAQPVQAAAQLKNIDLPQEFSASLYSPFSQPNPKAAASAKPKRNIPMLFKLKAGRRRAAMCIALAALLSDKFETVEKAVAELKIETGVLTGENEVSDTQIAALAKAFGLPEPQAAPVAQTNDSINRKDLAELKKIAAQAKLDESILDGWIEKGTSIADARAQAFDALAKRSEDQLPAGAHVRTVGAQLPLRTAVAQAMLAQARPGIHKASEDSNEFLHNTLMENAVAVLEYSGERCKGKSKDQIIAMAMNTTGDFPYIVQDVANKEMSRTYMEAPSTFKEFSRAASNSDFKYRNVVAMGNGSGMKKVNEHGELEKGTISEAKDSYKLDTYGVEFGFTRELMINDDLGAFINFMAQAGGSASRLESDVFYDLLLTGTPQYNGANLFNAAATRRTQITGTADLEAALVLMLTAMRLQVGLDSEKLNLTPAVLLVSPEREVAARKVLTSVGATEQGDVNVFANSMKLVVEARLAGVTNNPHYTIASPNAAPVFEHCYLRGSTGPFIEIAQVFGTRGMKLAIAHDFAAGIVGGVGIVKNPGA